jgi:hypothetical protein
MEWSFIFKLIGEKIFGSSRGRELDKQTQLVINEWKGLYEEKKNVLAAYENQKKIIENHKRKHPENGVELDQWLAREQELMLKLVRCNEQINFWKERCIFLEHENELLHRERE